VSIFPFLCWLGYFLLAVWAVDHVLTIIGIITFDLKGLHPSPVLILRKSYRAASEVTISIVKVMWIEYSIPADLERQRQIIRHLRTWIEGIGEKGLVRGFAFNHYSGQANVQDDLRVRFDYPEEVNLEIERELTAKVRELIPEFSAHGTPWDSIEEILKGYEFGSRCAFLFWQMAERGRFPEEFLSNYLNMIDATHFAGFRPLPFNFQSHFYHGVMNSLGVQKEPNELFLHALAIIECKHFHSSDELCAWIRTLPQYFFEMYP
jgi:hypothetical protein